VPSRVRLVSDAEYVASFRERLDEAVADRLRAPAASMLLSGGLDSPALAASAVRARPGVLRLALTISAEPLLHADEEPLLARAVARRLEVPHEVMSAEPSLAMAHCDDAGLSTPEPVDAAQLQLWRRQVGRLAEVAPLSLHGEDGDALFAPPDLRTMLRTMPVPALLRDWVAYRLRHGEAPWSGLRELAIGARRRAAREAAAWAAPSWLREDLVRRHGTDRPPARTAHPTRPQAAAALRSVDWESFTMMIDSGTTGVPHAFVLPFLDLRLLEFVFSIPPIPWAQRKWMLRRAFRGVLPPEVLDRPKAPLRGFREALVARWRESGGAHRALPVAMDHWVDVPAWRRVLRESPDAERVMEAWRVFEAARWLTQRAVG
jgi:asparagine synthase (glutamine-hydrolysing)